MATAPIRDIIEVMAVIHIPEAEAARDFAGVIARVTAGEEVVIDTEAGRSVAIRAVEEPRVRTLSDFVQWREEHRHLVDEDFARDVEEARNWRRSRSFDTNVEGMVARHWRGWTTRENADVYEKLLREKVLPELRRIAGYHGGILLRSDGQDEVEFVVVNLFESLEAVRSFAGPDYAVPVFEPEARQLLSNFEPIAKHYEVRASSA